MAGELRALSYRIAGAAWGLTLSTEVVTRLSSAAQRGRATREAVGQLYCADLTAEILHVDHISTLKPRWSGYSGVKLDINQVRKERQRMYQQGFHCLGFWHSHPEPRPEPSPEDLLMAAEHARAGKNEFQGLLFIIVGTDPFPAGLGVWVHDGESVWKMKSELDRSLSGRRIG